MADNESIHGSLGRTYENNLEEIGISMVVVNEPAKVVNAEKIADEY